ncbi:hypothetical protein, partial [Deinococcus sp. 12RED42]|uniref:hypothetical protein n=1 Tax=Deinococcus sp. 12RED42 TaxID=2745872 RepID=UPI001E328FB6
MTYGAACTYNFSFRPARRCPALPIPVQPAAPRPASEEVPYAQIVPVVCPSACRPDPECRAGGLLVRSDDIATERGVILEE